MALTGLGPSGIPGRAVAFEGKPPWRPVIEREQVRVSRGGAFAETLPLTRHQEAIVILLPDTLVTIPADVVLPAPVTETEEILLSLPEASILEQVIGSDLAKGWVPEVEPGALPSLVRTESAELSFETNSIPLRDEVEDELFSVPMGVEIPELSGGGIEVGTREVKSIGLALDFVQVVDYYGAQYRGYSFQVIFEIGINPEVLVLDSVRSLTPAEIDTYIPEVTFYGAD